jgi:hypothetical protein
MMSHEKKELKHSDIAKDMLMKVAVKGIVLDGCVMKGHTKGKMVKMMGGGSC